MQARPPHAIRSRATFATPDDPEPWRCAGKNRDGSRCKRLAVQGMRVCNRSHGGKCLRGPANPAWKDGRDSKYWRELKGSLAIARDRVDEEGSRVLSLLEGVAAMDVRLAELSARIEESDSPEWRVKVRKLWLNRDDPQAADELSELLEKGTARDSAWDEMFDRLIDRAGAAAQALTIDIRRDEAMTKADLVAAYQELFEAVRSALPSVQCPQCSVSADRAIEVIRSRVLPAAP